MGYATLNVWLRDERCRIIKRDAHLHVLPCCSGPEDEIRATLLLGHGEVKLPPGCYIVQAGVYIPDHTNIWTDRTMIIVRCGDEACVNLILRPAGSLEQPTDEARRPTLMWGGCFETLAVPWAIHARRHNITQERMQAALDVILQAFDIPRDQMVRALEGEADMLQQLEIKPDEEHLTAINWLRRIIG
jgi:hypothetical protein